MTVWKYELTLGNGGDVRTLNIPEDAIPIFVGIDPYVSGGGNSHELRLWMLVDESRPLVKRRFRIAGTGHPLPDNVKHVGSVVTPPFAWHVFELPA